MKNKRAVFGCKKCKREISHDLPVKNFWLAKNAIMNRGCSFCKHKPLESIGLVKVKLQCSKCKIVREYEVLGGKDFQRRVDKLVRERCPRISCLSDDGWKNISNTPIDDPDPD